MPLPRTTGRGSTYVFSLASINNSLETHLPFAVRGGSFLRPVEGNPHPRGAARQLCSELQSSSTKGDKVKGS
jgi:hypothetical protein